MLRKSFEEFLHDERGAYTLWSLVWFMLYVAIGGLAVDGTDAYRNQILLQATADSSALAGAMSLYVPDEDPVDAALAYAAANLDPEQHGTVLADTDVHLGIWDDATETFTEVAYDPTLEAAGVNAVYVVTRKGEQNGNPVVMNVLRILQGFGLNPWWNINTAAVAVRYIPDCLVNNGLVAWNKVDVTSNNNFNDICVHGQNAIVDPGHNYSIDINTGNVIGENTQFSQPDPSDFNNRPNVCDSNTGLCEEGVIIQGSMPAHDAFTVTQTTTDYENGTIFPEYMYEEVTNSETGETLLADPTVVTIENAENFTGPYEPYHVYDMNCSAENNQVNLPTGVMIEKVVIVADCSIGGSSGVQLRDMVLASSADGNGPNGVYQNSIHFPSGLEIGDSAFCDDSSGQVHIYSAASIQVAAGPTVYGLRMVAAGDIQFSAQNDVFGISAEAGNNITATANGNWEYCGGEFDGPFAFHYRLVR